MTKPLYVPTPVQAILAPVVLLPNLSDPNGWWAGSKPYNHGESWEDVTVKVAKDESSVGINFEPVRKNYDLCETSFIDALLPHAQKAVGGDYTRTQFRKDMFQMMFDMRSPVDGPKVTSNIGKMGDHLGRPTADMLAGLSKPKKTRKGVGTKAKTKVAA